MGGRVRLAWRLDGVVRCDPISRYANSDDRCCLIKPICHERLNDPPDILDWVRQGMNDVADEFGSMRGRYNTPTGERATTRGPEPGRREGRRDRYQHLTRKDSVASERIFGQSVGNRSILNGEGYAYQKVSIAATYLAKVGVVGSNPIARSKILDLIDGSAVTTLRAARPRCRAERERMIPKSGNRFSDEIMRNQLGRTLP